MATINTFLYWVQELHREAGAAGRSPTTVTGVTGEAARLVGWVKRANSDVQELWENWKFLRCTYSQACTPTINTLPAPTVPNAIGSGAWDLDTFTITRAGDSFASPLLAVEYDAVKTEQVDTSPGTPWRVVVMPDNSLRLEGTPNAADVIGADFYREAIDTELTVDDDTSSIPTRFQNIILGKALILYGNYEGATEAKTQGEEIWADTIQRLENSQLPNAGKSRYRTGNRIEVVAQ